MRREAASWPSIAVALGTALLALALINLAIVRNQQVLREGTVFYLQLAPVDPRSLLQGDYMALNYEISNQLRSDWPEQIPDAAWVSLSLDPKGIAGNPELSAQAPAAAPGTVVLQVRKQGWQVVLATDGYYFEEGQGERYQRARYGQFHSDGGDKALLSTLVDENLNPL